MATCDMGYEHDDPAVVDDEPDPPAVVIDAGPNENDVKIAQIQADAGVREAKIFAEQHDRDLQSEVDELRGELRGVREILDRLSPPGPDPDAAPEPAVIPVPEPPAAPAEPVAPPPDAPPKKSGKKSGGGWWDGYA